MVRILAGKGAISYKYGPSSSSHVLNAGIHKSKHPVIDIQAPGASPRPTRQRRKWSSSATSPSSPALLPV
jgi:hypothetical protein